MNPTITLVGTAPLLMHGNGLADPISDDAKRMKRISGKRVKTDEDHIAMRRIEFESSLYLDPEVGPYLPGPNIAKALLLAARIRRQGPKIERGLILVSPINRLEYDGPRDVSGLWNAPRFRHVAAAKLSGKQTVMRCRDALPADLHRVVMHRDRIDQPQRAIGRGAGRDRLGRRADDRRR